MRSRFSASEISSSSASPRVPTSEKDCSRWPSAKSSQAAMNSRLSCARSSASSRRQAGSSFRKVYLTKCRSLTLAADYRSCGRRRPRRTPAGGYSLRACGSRSCRRTRGPIRAASRATSRRCRRAASGRPRGAHPRAVRSRRRALARAAPRRPPAAARAPPEDFVSLGRTVGIPGQRRRVELGLTAAGDLRAAARAARRRLRRGAHPRAGRAAARLGRALRAASCRSSAPSTPTRERRSPTASRAVARRRAGG